MRPDGSPTVSVVVPVWNPGQFLDRCLDSLLAQTLPSPQIEILFVDDGSTDGTADRLDDIAREHRHVVVRHEPNSGWAGRPRNVGIEAATGRWIQFLDQDDMLGPDALRRLTELGDASTADIVLGKVTSDWRPTDHDVFRHNLDNASLTSAPLIMSLTPHKMFRRSFLLEANLRFPEGRRRLEDQLFMVQAYLAARNVAIVGDYECYRYLRRDDGGNAGSRRIDPVTYYPNLEEVLDAVIDGTDPGPTRDLMLRRFLHSEVMRRLIDKPVLTWTPEHRSKFVTVTRPLVQRRFEPALQASMPVVDRAGLHLLRGGDEAGLLGLATWCSTISARAEVHNVKRTQAGWDLQINAGLVGKDGAPLLLESHGGGGWRFADDALPPGLADIDPDATADIEGADIAALVVQRGTRLTWFLPATWERELTPYGASRQELSFTGQVRLRPGAVENQAALSTGQWDVRIRLRAFGLSRSQRVRVASDVPRSSWQPLKDNRGRAVVTPTVLPVDRRLSLHVGGKPRSELLTEVRRRWFRGRSGKPG